MNRVEEYYRSFWAGQTTPLHRNNDEKTYYFYSQELRNIFTYLGYKGGSVLEIGCGNGALFPYLDFDINQYTGIDLSASLLAIFKKRYPEVDIKELAASDFIPKKKYQLIFGNAVHQHFSSLMLKEHLCQLLPALDEGGGFLLANLPCAALEGLYRDKYFSDYEPKSRIRHLLNMMRAAKRKLKILLNIDKYPKDSIGYWFNPSDIVSMIGSEYKIEVLGSNFYPYRIHLLICRKDENS